MSLIKHLKNKISCLHNSYGKKKLIFENSLALRRDFIISTYVTKVPYGQRINACWGKKNDCLQYFASKPKILNSQKNVSSKFEGLGLQPTLFRAQSRRFESSSERDSPSGHLLEQPIPCSLCQS